MGWMQENLALLGNQQLNQLCVPGAHDSGMSSFTSSTLFARPCNTITQTTDVLGQLQFGVRYFDIRPVISGGQYCTGHYTNTNSALGWQGANGQSIEAIINNVNTYTAANRELIIIDLSHDLNTDLGEPNYLPLTQEEWDALLSQLQDLNDLFLAPNPTSVDLATLTLNDFIASQAAVVVLAEPAATGIGLGDFAMQGFYTHNNFIIYNQYTGTNELNRMQDDQLNKLKAQRPTPDTGYFLLSWTLTQDDTQAAFCTDSSNSILSLAAMANETLSSALLPACSSQTYPNIILIDGVNDSSIADLAMELNNQAIKGSPSAL